MTPHITQILNAIDKDHWLKSRYRFASKERPELGKELLRRPEANGNTAEATRWRREVEGQVREHAPPLREKK